MKKINKFIKKYRNGEYSMTGSTYCKSKTKQSMKFIKCRKCGRYFKITDNDYCLSKCTGCGSTDLEETIYKFDRNSNIDWEQRRYEIAKDILATSHIAQQIGKYSYHYEEEVNGAVRMANMLIAELKKNNEIK